MAGEERVTKLKIDNVKKIYQTRKGEMTALNGVNLDIKENEFICVVGPSGCGKSTLLNILGCIHRWQKDRRNRYRERRCIPAVCIVPMADSPEKCYVWLETAGQERC